MLLGTLRIQFYTTIIFWATTVLGGSASTCALFKDSALGNPGFRLILGNVSFKDDESTLYSLLNESFYKSYNDYPNYSIDVTIPAFNIPVPDSDKPVTGQLYPTVPHITISNFTALYAGVFPAPTTGDYLFEIDTASDAAAMYIFDNLDMYCCDDMDYAG